ncbi:MAG: Dihydroorotate dehydrogenase [Parachlamydiales bacterium]|nr:Dihydroorotate dehydrogenase [Parachlamydiales bacterium]
MNDIPKWFPAHLPIYDIHKTYEENASEGPFFCHPIPSRPEKISPIDFLGRTLNSPIGVPAGPLLNARWISLASRLGFDLLTYKTIRSLPHRGHPLPNMIFVRARPSGAASVLEKYPNDSEELTLTNSFGMPSQSRDFLLEDIDRAASSLQRGQAMIVSIVGTPRSGRGFADDFIDAAMIARDAGAQFIEANFSCPNVSKSEGMLYQNPEAVYEFARAIAKAIHPLPLILKVGLFPSREIMQKVLQSASSAGVRAVCGINSVSMRVVDSRGLPALGVSRPTSGVCGAAIRGAAMQFIADAAQIIRKEKLDLTLMGCGGLMRPEHFDECLSLGASIAMTATAMMWDPFLAQRYHWRNKDGK